MYETLRRSTIIWRRNTVFGAAQCTMPISVGHQRGAPRARHASACMRVERDCAGVTVA